MIGGPTDTGIPEISFIYTVFTSTSTIFMSYVLAEHPLFSMTEYKKLLQSYYTVTYSICRYRILTKSRHMHMMYVLG